MANTSNDRAPRDMYYFRRRYKNRVFSALASFIAEEMERTGITKKDVAERLRREPSQITRWLSGPGNLTLDTISDMLFALDAEADPPHIVRFLERAKPNFAHPMVQRIMGAQATHNVEPSVQIKVFGGQGKSETISPAKAVDIELVPAAR